MDTRESLLHAVREYPEQDAPRLIYADWLDEYGECDRDRATAEFIRLCCDNKRWHPGKRMPRGAYDWLLSPAKPKSGDDYQRRFPLPNGAQVKSNLYRHNDEVSGEPVWREHRELERPVTCNWHRLVPTFVAFDAWNKVSERARECAELNNIQPTPQATREGRCVRVTFSWKTTPMVGQDGVEPWCVELRFRRGFVSDFTSLSHYPQDCINRAILADQPFAEYVHLPDEAYYDPDAVGN